jgi:hypothetical protein
MLLLPVIERELRIALRKKQPVRSRTRVAAVCAGLALLCSLNLIAFSGGKSVGRELHNILCIAGFYAVIRTPGIVAGVLAEERRNQTLGLLFLSGLGALEVFIGKLLSAATLAFNTLLAITPMLALPFLMGGVSFELFFATICCLPNLLLFALAITLLASALTRDEGAAFLLAVALGAIICGGGPAIYFLKKSFGFMAPDTQWLLTSPAYGGYLVLTGFARGSAPEFWRNFAVTLSLTAISLPLAAWTLKRAWRDREEDTQVANGRWFQWLHGGKLFRRRLAARWLNANPFVWLVARDRQPVALMWLVLVVIGILWAACAITWPLRWPTVPNLFFTATLLNLLLRWAIQHTAARGIGEPRRDGTYELLLTTRLQPSDIVQGQFEALRIHFRPFARAVILIEVLLMTAGLLLRQWTPGALIVYFAVWLGLMWWTFRLGWVSSNAAPTMWVALNCGRPVLAVWKTNGFSSWIWIWLIYNLHSGISRLPAFPTGSLVEMFLCMIVSFSMLTSIGQKVGEDWEPRLVRHFREIVREPIPDPDDPRFKSWNIYERFPWGWTIAQQQLHERLARHKTVTGNRSPRA